jgi:hypothetical protein
LAVQRGACDSRVAPERHIRHVPRRKIRNFSTIIDDCHYYHDHDRLAGELMMLLLPLLLLLLLLLLYRQRRVVVGLVRVLVPW